MTDWLAVEANHSLATAVHQYIRLLKFAYACELAEEAVARELDDGSG